MNEPKVKPELVTAEYLAEKYSVSPKTIRKWGAEGLIPYVKFSRRAVRYPIEAIDRIVEERYVPAATV